jgi:hypothetical protein
MKPPIGQPRDRQMSERRHYDPPALWYAVVLSSVVIHLSAFGIVRLLLMAGLVGTSSATKLIPIDVIAMATPAAGIASPKFNPSIPPNNTSTTQLPPKATSKPTTRNNQDQNRKTASTSSPTRTKTQTGATKQPAVNTKKSPTSNSSKPSGKVPSKTKPSTPTGKNNQPGTATATPNSPSPIGTPSNKPTPNSQSEGGFIALPGKLALIPSKTDILHPGNPNYNDELAELLNGNKQLSSADLKQLGISLNRDIELKVELVVKTDGTAEVFSVSVVTGSLSQDNALVIANKIVPQLLFKPTKMAGSFVYGNYSLPLIIRPAPK